MLTAAALYDVVQCSNRLALDHFGDRSQRDTVSPFVRMLWERGTEYERDVVARLKGEREVVDLSCFTGDEKERRTQVAMLNRAPLIYSGRIRVADLLGEPDLLRLEGDGRYTPGDIKSGAAEEGDDSKGRAPKTHYAVQLGLYIDILERLGRSAGRSAFVWDIHGKEVPYQFDRPRRPRRRETLWDDYEAARDLARGILEGRRAGEAAYSSICKLCHWHSFCLETLVQADDLTLVPFLGRSVRDSLAPRINSIGELARADLTSCIVGKGTIFRGVRAKRLATFQQRAVLLKSREPRPYFKKPVSLPPAEHELFFDIEVDPMADRCYLHGFLDRVGADNATERFVPFLAASLSPDGERQAFAAAWNFVRHSQPAVIYYYSKYERTIYRKLQARYPDVCSQSEVEGMFDRVRAIDLYGDVVLACTEWPTRDYSIKSLAKHLGFYWRDPNPSGSASIEWAHRWYSHGDPIVRERILAYNEDDCRATRVLVDAIRTLPHSVRDHADTIAGHDYLMPGAPESAVASREGRS